MVNHVKCVKELWTDGYIFFRGTDISEFSIKMDVTYTSAKRTRQTWQEQNKCLFQGEGTWVHFTLFSPLVVVRKFS